MDLVLTYAPLVLLGVLAVFVISGILTGMARGFKRSLLRFVLYVGLLVAVFFLAPLVTNALLGINVQIAGRTPQGWVDFLGEQLAIVLQDSFGKYVAPFGGYVQELALGLVLAVVNIALFTVMYFVLKLVTWILYTILAHVWAPTKDRKGNKLPKNAGGGMLIGALQGLCLFMFFMLPINGLLGVVHHAVVYQEAQTEVVATMSAGDDYTDADGEIDLGKVFTEIDGAMGTYNSVMKYTGLQFLSDKAFEYQLTVRIDGAEPINLVHDINSVLELYIDSQNLETTFVKLEELFTGKGYKLSSTDYQRLRSVVNKVFDLNLLNLADWFLADLDNVLNMPFGEDETYLEGTTVIADSIYGNLIQTMATTREIEGDVNKYAELEKGMRVLVRYVADKKLDLVRYDILTLLDIAEAVTAYQIVYGGETQTVVDVFAQNTLNSWDDYLELVTTRLAVASGEYAVETPLVNVLGTNLQKLSLAQMLGLPGVENLVMYSSMLDEAFEGDQDVQNLVYGLADLFLGEKAYTKGENQGSWEKLGGELLAFADVLRDNRTLFADITDMLNGGETDIQAVIGKIGELIISEEYYDEHKTEFGTETYENVRYQKVDRLVNSIYDLVNTFEPVQKFVALQMDKMAEDSELLGTLADLLTGEREAWQNKFRSLISAANLMNNEQLSSAMDKLQNSETLAEEDIAGILGALESELDTETVVEIVDTVVNLPEVGDEIKDTLSNVLSEVISDENNGILADIFEGDDVGTVTDNIQTLIDYMNPEEEISKTELETAVESLLTKIGDNQYIQDYLKNLGQA